MRPLIAVTGQKLEVSSGPARVGVNAAYVESVAAAGGLPVVVPPLADVAGVGRFLDAIDGIVLTGGGDVDPGLYGEANAGSKGIDPDRDAVEVALVRGAIERGLPMLGICRGQQLINVALGGTLIQDVDGHLQAGDREAVTHEVEIVAPESVLGRAAGGRRIAVNTFHHQVVGEVAPGLQVTALSAEGEPRWIEGLESADGGIVGVQCHPEHLRGATGWAATLFAHLVERARDYRSATASASA